MQPPALIPGLWNAQRYPANYRNTTHGWRWYRLENGKLLSPLQGYPLELPCNGFLPGAYFIPHVGNLWSMVVWLRDHVPYEIAVTFGTVSGPFQRDLQMPLIGSMSATSYQAQVIVADRATAIVDSSYEMPMVHGISDLFLLQRIENAVRAVGSPTPTPS